MAKKKLPPIEFVKNARMRGEKPRPRNPGRLGERNEKGQHAPFVPTQEQRAAVAAMTATFCSHKLIATQLAIDEKTLRKHFAVELDTAVDRATATVVGRLYEHTKKYPLACFFWLQNRDAENWQDKRNLNLKHEAGGSFADIVARSFGLPVPAPAPASNGHDKPATNGHAKPNGHSNGHG